MALDLRKRQTGVNQRVGTLSKFAQPAGILMVTLQQQGPFLPNFTTVRP